jgi:hypothetical protein
MTRGEWYNPNYATYKVRLATQFEAEKAKSVCWDISAEAAAKGVAVGGAGITSCTAWTQPAESFMWILKVEPEWVTTGNKRDNPLGWHDIDGSTYDCNGYSQGESLSVIFSWFQYEYHMLLKCALLTRVLLCHDGVEMVCIQKGSYCASYGNDYRNFGKMANEACAVCGGGSRV